MDSNYARIVSSIFSIFLLISATTLVLIHQSERSDANCQLDDGTVKKVGVKTTANGVSNRKLVETVYKNNGLHNYHRKFSRQLELAKNERKKECGTFIKFSAIDCDVCILFVTGLNLLIEKGSTQEDVVEFTTKACIDLKIEDERVCKAITREFKVSETLKLFKICFNAEVM